jgi:hypothetical protein
MDTMSTIPRPAINADFDWDLFSPVSYNEHNYQEKRADDHEIVERVRDFFGRARIRSGARGVDVGPGANLYPCLGMLPFVDRLDLREYSASNVFWLERQVKSYDANWDDFWDIYAQHPAWRAIADPRARLERISTVTRESVFNLPRSTWDIGTMFFVACSISTQVEEFRLAIRCFVHSLKPGAPFATAFMVNSQGYQVGERWFPAVAIGTREVTECLASLAYDVEIHEIDTDNPLREGCGMLVATGRAIG